jgi:membrane protein implicated in regulation of membrane protease activity
LIGAGIALLIATLLLGLLLAAPALILFAADLDAAGIVAGIVAGLILLPLLLVASGALGAFPLLLDAGLPASHQRLWRPSSAMRRRNVETKTGY